ncbi:MAG TPA: hypothetical protein VFG43_01480 [Geminicoccaceae bacterium]|nr:hypothetical protein [Geminicoccaceae bacterium]
MRPTKRTSPIVSDVATGLTLLALGAGDATAGIDPNGIGATDLTDNAIVPGALTGNALGDNALVVNALVGNAVAPNAGGSTMEERSFGRADRGERAATARRRPARRAPARLRGRVVPEPAVAGAAATAPTTALAFLRPSGL